MKTVLVVSPDGRRRGALVDALSACGLSVKESKSSAEAMGLVRTSNVDGLVITDEARRLALSGLCGLVKKGRSEAPLFVLLNNQSDQGRVTRAAGADAVLVPFGHSPEEVASLVMKTFGTNTPAVWKFERVSSIQRNKLWEVMIARERGTNSEVFLVQLSDQFAKDSELRAEFIEAVTVAQSLEHPNLPRILEVGGAEDLPYVAMQYTPGDTLHNLRRKLSGGEAWLSTCLSTWVVSEVLVALELIHGASLVHGAISPESIWLTHDGRVQLLFVGVENVFSMLERGMASTLGVAGPQPYLSAQQITEGANDPSSDIFVVSIVLYELLARKHLFLRNKVSTTREAILKHEVPDLNNGIPSDLADLALEGLEKEPGFRLQSAASFRTKLTDLLKSPAMAQKTEEQSSGLLKRIFKKGATTQSLPDDPSERSRLELGELLKKTAM